MTAPEYLRMLLRHAVVLLVPVVCGIALAAGYLARTPPRYEATSQLFFSAPTRDQDSIQLIVGLSFLQSRMPSYAALVTSPLVQQAAITSGQLPFTPAQLSARTAVEQPGATTLLNISVTDADARRAASSANLLAAEVGQAVQRLDGAGTSADSPVTARQTHPAQPPARPSWPQPGPVLAAGGLLGLALGLLIAAARHVRDSTVRGRAGVLRATGLEPIAVIPWDQRSSRWTARRHPAAAGGARAEAYVMLRTALQQAGPAGAGRVIAVISALPQEGRTTVAVDLAYVLALSGSDVVLVETDLRKPRIARLLRIGYGPGLVNTLLGQFSLEDVQVRFAARKLSVLPAGLSAQGNEGLLSSPAMADLLARLRASHGHVIVDTPSAASAGAMELAAVADEVLVVVRHDSTPAPALADLMRSLRRVRASVAGVVLNAEPGQPGAAPPPRVAVPARRTEPFGL